MFDPLEHGTLVSIESGAQVILLLARVGNLVSGLLHSLFVELDLAVELVTIFAHLTVLLRAAEFSLLVVFQSFGELAQVLTQSLVFKRKVINIAPILINMVDHRLILDEKV